MNSKLLNFLFVLACAALLGLGSLRAQNPTTTSDGNGNAVSAPSRQSDAGHSAVSPSSTPSADKATADSRRDARDTIANDRGTVPESRASKSEFHLNVGWIGLLGLLGLLGLIRRNDSRTRQLQAREEEKPEYRRVA